MAAPVLALHADVRSLAEPIADVLAAVVHAQLVRHPVVSMLDPDAQRIVDEQGSLLNVTHERFDEMLERSFLDDRRDEVVWLELGFEAGKALHAKLRVVTPDDRSGTEVNATGEPTLSGLLATCIAQWLATRRLPPAIGAWPLFGATELFTAAAQVARFRADALRDPGSAAIAPGFGGALEVAATRAAWKGLEHGQAHRASVRRVLALVPDEVHALRAEAVYRIEEGVTPHVAMGPVVALAPQWATPHLAMHGAGLPEAEALRHAATASLLAPADPHALHAFAICLSRAGRFEEAVRIADRAAAADPLFVQARVTALRALRDTHRSGEAYLVARARAEEVAALVGTTVSAHASTALSLVYAEAAFDVGRLDDAIAITEGALETIAEESSFRRQRDELVRWKREPETLAASFARDGHFRADPGRVLEGFSRTRPRFSLDVAMIVRALVTIGHEDVALLACAEHLGGGVATGPHARAARALARMVAGDVAGAMEDATVVALRHPQSKLETEIHRVLRLGATREAGAFERTVGRWTDRGARRIARLMARDAADFVPGLETSSPMLEALGPRASTVFDAAWLEPLVNELGMRSLVAIEAFFGQYKRPTIEHADRLAGDWHMLIAPSRRDELTWLEQVVYVLAQSLGRYLVATTDAPSPLAGGYRQVAADALALVHRFGRDWKSDWLPPLLGVVEAASTGVDPWLLDAWLVRVERAFGLEHETGAHLGAATRDAPRVRRSLRGDERIAFEHGFALELLAEGHGEQAAELLERTVRAVGAGTPALRWGDAARSKGGDVLDVLWTAALANAAHPAGWAHVARASFAAKRPEDAFEALLRAMPVAGDDWRVRVLAELRERWEDAGLEVPIDPAEAEAAGIASASRGDRESALRCFRWAHACDPSNASRAEALAAERARIGDADATLEALATSGRLDAVTSAATLLEQEGAGREAARVRRYGEVASEARARLAGRAGAAQARSGRGQDALGADAPAHDVEVETVVDGARRALWAGDREGALAVVAGNEDWPSRRLALAAAELRYDASDTAPVRRAAVVAAEDVLRATAGATDLDAVLARVHALRIRESFCFPIDPPPPLGSIMTRETFEARWRKRTSAEGDPDRPTVPLEVTQRPPPRPLAPQTYGAPHTTLHDLPMVVLEPERTDRQAPAAPVAIFDSSSGAAATWMLDGAEAAVRSVPTGVEMTTAATASADEPCPLLTDFVAAVV
ncbi:MAG: hypothetical protein IT379_35455, partial [Deltaproteobacteria bacterium]|nr:hypothetical protein [Deltaproteobacteria bacterium]